MPPMKAMKAREHTKVSKRTRRERRDDGRWSRLRLHPLGGRLDPIVERRTIDAFSSVDLGGSWEQLSPLLLPLLKRVAHPFPAEAAPIHLRVPPGVWAGFGIDVGPAWAHVSRALVDRWGVDEATLLGTALENLRRRAAAEPPRIETATIGGISVTVAQAQGWGSALVLAPDRLREIVGSAPRLILTPVRNALVVLPEDVDVDLAVAIWEAFAEGCHDELDVDPLRWTGTALVALGDDMAERELVH
jgi:hypothetical protein